MTFGTAVFAIIAAAAGAIPGGVAFVPRIVSEHAISLRDASDVRWVDADHVLVTDTYNGIVRLSLSGSDVVSLPEWPHPNGPGTSYTCLAISGDTVVVGDFAFSFRWRERGKTALHREFQEFIADLDLDGDRILLSGLRRDSDGKMGQDGAFAWIGSLRGGERSLRPVLPFRDMGSIENCASFGLGAVRFLSNGSFMVVPGAEGGIYLYDKSAKLQRVWQTDPLGIDTDCEMSREQQSALGPNVVARQQWVNRRRIVDEILDTPAGPALIARKVTPAGTHWDLILLASDGSVSERSLPFESSSPWAHVAAATRANRAVFVIADRVPPSVKRTAPPRLILAEWPQR